MSRTITIEAASTSADTETFESGLEGSRAPRVQWSQPLHRALLARHHTELNAEQVDAMGKFWTGV